LIVKARRATDAMAECRRNAGRGLEVLRAYGIDNITSARQEWWADRETYALLLEDGDSGEPLGGVRLQRFRPGVPLPLERALAGVDPRVHAWTESFAERGVGELCGLWRATEVRGFGLGSKLTAMGIAVAAELRVGVLLGICDTKHVRENARLGFGVERTLASNGTFEYPRPALRAQVLRLDDPVRLQTAFPDARAAVEHYRSEPVGVELVRNDEWSFELERDLRLWPVTSEAAHEVAAPPEAT
jgi:hypothetical protein